MKRRSFSRKQPHRNYRKIFLIATEGKITEPSYFLKIKEIYYNVNISFMPKNNQSSPQNLLKYLEKYLSKHDEKKFDEVWIVLDTDSWTEDQLNAIVRWSESPKKSYHLANSNPRFEFWLCLHFREASKITDLNSLEKYLSLDLKKTYEKSENFSFLKKEDVEKACTQAKKLIHDEGIKILKTKGSTIYRLIEKIKIENEQT